jgi:hypothetical protein
MTSSTPDRRRSVATSMSIRAALTSMKGAVSASSTTALVPGSAAWARMTSRTVSALAKNRPPSTRSSAIPGGCSFSGWRRTSPYWPGMPGTWPSTATCGREAR